MTTGYRPSARVSHVIDNFHQPSLHYAIDGMDMRESNYLFYYIYID